MISVKVRNPFKDRERRAIFETMVALACDPSSELYFKGQRRTGASHRACFWAGVENVESGRPKPVWIPANDSFGYTSYRAGQEWQRARAKAGAA